MKQKGIALIMVLWASVLMSIIIGSFAMISRMENIQSRFLFDRTRALYAAEAGLHRAIYEMKKPQSQTEESWIADGRPYEIEFDDVKVTVSITDESGKLDVNVADEILLAGLFDSIDIQEETRDQLIGAIIDWRDADDLVRINGAEDDDYVRADYAYEAKDALFDTIDEIQLVMGMDYAIYRKIKDAITVYSGQKNINPAFANKSALMALGMTANEADEYIDARWSIDQAGMSLPALPDGSTPVSTSRGTTFSITCLATLKNNISETIETTIRLMGPGQKKAYSLLRWEQGVLE